MPRFKVAQHTLTSRFNLIQYLSITHTIFVAFLCALLPACIDLYWSSESLLSATRVSLCPAVTDTGVSSSIRNEYPSNSKLFTPFQSSISIYPVESAVSQTILRATVSIYSLKKNTEKVTSFGYVSRSYSFTETDKKKWQFPLVTSISRHIQRILRMFDVMKLIWCVWECNATVFTSINCREKLCYKEILEETVSMENISPSIAV